MSPLLALVLAATPACRESPLGDAPEAELRRDLDGDGAEDHLEARTSGGSGQSTTWVTLTLTTRPAPLELSVDTSFYSIVASHPVPELLLRPGLAAARAAVEDVLFGRTCDGPDPSLAWLLETKHTLRWIPGAPVLPETYAILRPGEGRGRQVWTHYLGHNHRRGDGPVPRELARKGDRALLGTAHGVVLAEPARHAWIYVHRGGQKLRIPTVASARFEGEVAVIELVLAQTEDAGTARVDLRTGALLGVERVTPR